jgi:hypothetical protein
MSGARPRFPRLGLQRAARAPGALTAQRLVSLLIPAFAAIGCGDEDVEPWQPTLPVRISAEDGTLGASVMRVTDAMDSSITYVTATMNVTDPPADMADPRISSQTVEFPRAGEYQIYGRVRIGPGGPNDDSFFISIPGDAVYGLELTVQ